MSDPYNPCEQELKLTRNALELLNAYRFGAAIATKSALVARDVDILKDIQEHSPVIIKITVTTEDDDLCRIVEPGAPLSSERFNAVKSLSDNGIYTGILMMPILPFIEDSEENIINILQLAKEKGARFVYPAIGMTLRAGNREYYYEKLDAYFPGIKEKYVKRYDERYNCPSPGAKKLWTIFAGECDRLGLRYEMKHIIADYKRGYWAKQLELFE
jgi:DNA repair photolyase